MGIEPTHRGFADPCLTTWLRRQVAISLAQEARSGKKNQFEARRSLGLTCGHARYILSNAGKVTPSILRVLRLRIDLGINSIDSAYVDIKGTSEAAVGQASQG